MLVVYVTLEENVSLLDGKKFSIHEKAEADYKYSVAKDGYKISTSYKCDILELNK